MPPGLWRLRSPLATITLPCTGTDRPARTTDGTNDAKQKGSFLHGPLRRHKERLPSFNDGISLLGKPIGLII